MKKLFLSFFFISMMFASTNVYAADKPMTFIQEIADEAIANVKDKSLSKTEKQDKFRKLFVKAVDVEKVSQFALSRHWKTASVDQKKSFTQAFEDLTVETWSRRFDEYAGQIVKIIASRPAEGKGQTFVDSKVLENEKDPNPIEVIWRLRQDKDGNYKIVDIIVEGVSMAMTYRKEYGAILSREGTDVADLISMLNQKVADIRSGKIDPTKEENKKS